MTEYDEGQVKAFIQDGFDEYRKRGLTPDEVALVWPSRVTWDARDIGWLESRRKHLAELIAALGGTSPVQPAHVGPGPLNEDRAEEVVQATEREFPRLLRGFGSDEEAVAAGNEFRRRVIWHLHLAGFKAGGQRNPSGINSQDKITVFVDGSWKCFDILSVRAGSPADVHFNFTTGADPVEDAGIPD
jgi:hypothetical protein